VSQNEKKTISSTRATLIQSLNEDLAREYQATIAYVVYSQMLKGAEYMNMRGEPIQRFSFSDLATDGRPGDFRRQRLLVQ
jgi:hypothetical protein